MMVNGINKINSNLIRILIAAVICIIVVMILVALAQPNKDDVNDFASCVKSGGGVMTTSPEQCVINGKTFTSNAQSDEKDESYVGLSEEDALEKASNANKPHRVVERDGEALPVTMDYVPGRLNFHVRDDQVYRVEIEGDERDE